MHYPLNVFAINNAMPTIVPKVRGSRFGDAKVISPVDALKLQMAYQCIVEPVPESLDPSDIDEDDDLEDSSLSATSISRTVKLSPRQLLQSPI